MNEPSPRAVKAAEGIQQMFTPGYTMPPVEEAMAHIIERETGAGEAADILESIRFGSPYQENQDGDDCWFCGFHSGNADKKMKGGTPEADLHHAHCPWLRARAFLGRQ